MVAPSGPEILFRQLPGLLIACNDVVMVLGRHEGINERIIADIQPGCVTNQYQILRILGDYPVFPNNSGDQLKIQAKMKARVNNELTINCLTPMMVGLTLTAGLKVP